MVEYSIELQKLRRTQNILKKLTYSRTAWLVQTCVALAVIGLAFLIKPITELQSTEMWVMIVGLMATAGRILMSLARLTAPTEDGFMLVLIDCLTGAGMFAFQSPALTIIEVVSIVLLIWSMSTARSVPRNISR